MLSVQCDSGACGRSALTTRQRTQIFLIIFQTFHYMYIVGESVREPPTRTIAAGDVSFGFKIYYK